MTSDQISRKKKKKTKYGHLLCFSDHTLDQCNYQQTVTVRRPGAPAKPNSSLVRVSEVDGNWLYEEPN
jgi:hypothetical protein